jgi:HK97 family phage portal protein
MTMARAIGAPEYARHLINVPDQIPDEDLQFPFAYALVPDVYACIHLIQSVVCTLPLRFYRGLGDDRVEIKREYNNVVDIWMGGNRLGSEVNTLENVVGSMLIAGCGYIYKQHFNLKKPPQELWVLPGHTVRIWPGINRSIAKYDYFNGSEYQEIVPKDIVRIPMYTPFDSLYGMSPLTAARLSYETARNSQKYNHAFYEKGGAMSMLMYTDGHIMPDVKKAMLNDLKKKGQGIRNAWNATLIPNTVKVERSGLTHREMEFIDNFKMTRAQIAQIFHVPPVLLGIKEGGGLSDAGSSTDMMMFWEICIKPILKRIERAITEQLLPDFDLNGQLSCEFDLSGPLPLQEIFYAQAKTLNEATGGPVMSPAEARQRLRLKDLHDKELEKLRKRADPEPTPHGEPNPQPIRVISATPAKPADIHTIEWDIAGASRSLEDQKRVADWEKEAMAVRDAMLRAQEQRVLSAYKALTTTGRSLRIIARIDDPIQRQDDDLDVILAALHNPEDRERFGKFIQRLIAEQGDIAMSAVTLAMAFDDQAASLRRFYEEHLDRAITIPDETTWRMLRRSVSDGVASGETTEQIAIRIADVFGIRRSNIATIARTEVTPAYNYASLEAWKQSGAVASAKWITARDEFVRGNPSGPYADSRFSHYHAHGQIRALGDLFDVGGRPDSSGNLVGGEQLRFPGDPSGSPGNIIECHCTVSPIARRVHGEAGRNGDGHVQFNRWQRFASVR